MVAFHASLSGFCPPQGQHYRTYELAKNADPEKEEEEEFQAAIAVHPVSDMTLMYRLHKHFSRILACLGWKTEGLIHTKTRQRLASGYTPTFSDSQEF